MPLNRNNSRGQGSGAQTGSKYGDSLGARHKTAFKNKGLASKFKTIWKDDSTKAMKISEGSHVVDLVPYICGDNNPYTQAGNPDYVLDIYVHYDVGPTGAAFICLARTFGDNQRCPICEKQQAMKREDTFTDKEIKALDAKRRTFYNVIEYDNNNNPSEFKILDMAHWNLERHLAVISCDPRGEGQIIFSDPVNGKQVCFVRTGMGQTNTNYSGHRLLDRNYTLGDNIVQEAPCLDELIEIPTFEEMLEAVNAMDDMNDETQPQGDEDDIPMSPGERTRPTPEGGRACAPVPMGKKTDPEKVCPHGGEFGFDNGQLANCDDCDNWDDCSLEADFIDNQDDSSAPTPDTKKKFNK